MGKFIFPAFTLLTLVCGGCTLCPNCDPDAFGAYGGRWERTDRDRGRVGSMFAPAGAQVPYDAQMPHGATYQPEATPESTEDAATPNASDRESGENATPEKSVIEPEPKSVEERLKELRQKQIDNGERAVDSI